MKQLVEGADDGEHPPAGFLVKQGGKIKTWKKRYFVLFGLRLRWYDSHESFMKNQAPNGEISCASVESQGRGKTCIRDMRGTRDLIVRSEMGDRQLLDIIRGRVAPIQGEDAAKPLQPDAGLSVEEALADRTRAQTAALGAAGGGGGRARQTTQLDLTNSVMEAAAAANTEVPRATAKQPPRKSLPLRDASTDDAGALALQQLTTAEPATAAASSTPVEAANAGSGAPPLSTGESPEGVEAASASSASPALLAPQAGNDADAEVARALARARAQSAAFGEGGRGGRTRQMTSRDFAASVMHANAASGAAPSTRPAARKSIASTESLSAVEARVKARAAAVGSAGGRGGEGGDVGVGSVGGGGEAVIGSSAAGLAMVGMHGHPAPREPPPRSAVLLDSPPEGWGEPPKLRPTPTHALGISAAAGEASSSGDTMCGIRTVLPESALRMAPTRQYLSDEGGRRRSEGGQPPMPPIDSAKEYHEVESGSGKQGAEAEARAAAAAEASAALAASTQAQAEALANSEAGMRARQTSIYDRFGEREGSGVVPTSRAERLRLSLAESAQQEDGTPTSLVSQPPNVGDMGGAGGSGAAGSGKAGSGDGDVLSAYGNQTLVLYTSMTRDQVRCQGTGASQAWIRKNAP